MKKKLGMMLTVAGTGMLLGGCGYFAQFDNFENAAKLRVGMTKEQVKEIMGEPVDEVFTRPDLWYYYVNTQWHDGLTTRDECMPLVFKDGKLAGWGNDYYNRMVVVERRFERPVIEGVNSKVKNHPALKAPEYPEDVKLEPVVLPTSRAAEKSSDPAADVNKEDAAHPDIKPVE
jgi:hypothetical protein